MTASLIINAAIAMCVYLQLKPFVKSFDFEKKRHEFVTGAVLSIAITSVINIFVHAFVGFVIDIVHNISFPYFTNLNLVEFAFFCFVAIRFMTTPYSKNLYSH